MSATSTPLVFTHHLSSLEADSIQSASRLTLALTAQERTKTRHYFQAELAILDQTSTEAGSMGLKGVYLRLPRGTVLQDGDRLTTTANDAILAIVAKPEPVMTVAASNPAANNTLALLKAAYHLGNRHVTLEVQETWLRFSPDPVLKHLLEQMGLTVTLEETPFYPESGAYTSAQTHHHLHLCE
ncbi:MAG: urease accessory protein UreE [Cyanothece sp. SIO2G6]|nr:urease accessory protein UreE [Cyanothece sp. SIO2G6]